MSRASQSAKLGFFDIHVEAQRLCGAVEGLKNRAHILKRAGAKKYVVYESMYAPFDVPLHFGVQVKEHHVYVKVEQKGAERAPLSISPALRVTDCGDTLHNGLFVGVRVETLDRENEVPRE